VQCMGGQTGPASAAHTTSRQTLKPRTQPCEPVGQHDGAQAGEACAVEGKLEVEQQAGGEEDDAGGATQGCKGESVSVCIRVYVCVCVHF